MNQAKISGRQSEKSPDTIRRPEGSQVKARIRKTEKKGLRQQKQSDKKGNDSFRLRRASDSKGNGNVSTPKWVKQFQHNLGSKRSWKKERVIR